MEYNVTPNGTAQPSDQLREMVGKAEELLGTLADDGKAGVGELRQRVKKTLQNAKAKLGDLQTQANGMADQAVTTTDDYVRDNPWTAVAIAAAAGVVLGALVSRRI